MTSTSRGAAAPAGDRAGTGPAATAAGAASFDAGALSATVDDVADHAVSWAKTDAAARADLLERVIADTMAVQDEWLAAASAAKGLRPGTTEAGEELFTGIGTFIRMARLLPRRSARHRQGRQARLRRAGARGGGRPAAGPGLPFRRIRPDHVPPDDRRDLHAARRDPGVPGRRAGRGLCRSPRPRWHRAGPRRWQRGVTRATRRPLQALRPGQGRRDEDQSGQRLPGAVLEPCAGRVGRRRRAAHRRRWRRGGAVPDWALRHRRGAHHGLGQDLRRRRLRHRSRGSPPQASG